MSDSGTDTVGKILDGLVKAGEHDAKAWLKEGDDISRYTTSNDYDFLYQEFPGETSFKARVNKAAEFQQTLGPYLYPQMPDASFTSEPWADPWAVKRHRVEEQYVDHAARAGALGTHMKRTVAHALLYGRAPLWTGYNQRKRLVQSVSDITANMLLDPDAKVEEEINWQGRVRIKPRWEVLQLFPDQKALIERLPAYTAPERARSAQGDRASELVKYQELWLGVGVGNYAPSLAAAEADTIAAPTARQKYCVADGHVLKQGDWEIPFFLIDEWPGTPLDLLEKPGCLYPYQPMEPGVGHLRAMNWLYTTFIAKYTFMSRTPFARMTINGQKVELDQLHKILHGEQIDIVNVVVNGNEDIADINKLFQRIDWGDPVPGFERIWSLCESQFERSTGLTEVLSTGQTPSQIRSATAANLIESRSKNRVDAMREATMKFLERIFRKTVFAARFLEGSEEIGQLFGPEAGALWGELAHPDQVAQETQLRGQVGQQMASIGMPPEQIDQQLGPPQFVNMEQWLTEADRTIDAGSMRRLDLDAQAENLNVAMTQFAPAAANIPGGQGFIAALAAEFTKINRLSPELRAAAQSMVQMANAPPPPPGPPPALPPNAGPTGGQPQVPVAA